MRFAGRILAAENLGISARFAAGFWPPRFLEISAEFWPPRFRNLGEISSRSKNLGGQNPAENLTEISVKILYGKNLPKI